MPTPVAFGPTIPSERKKHCPGAQLPLSPAGMPDEIFPLELMNLDRFSHEPFYYSVPLKFTGLIKLFCTYKHIRRLKPQ